jgi:outer membrane autotransporter protein
MKVRMDGKNLDLNAASADKIAAAVYVTDNAHVEILNNAKDKTLSIHASNTDTRAANGILSKGSYSSLHMEGPVEISNIMTAGDGAAGISVDGQNSEVILDGTLTVKNVSGKREQGRGQNAAGIRVVGDNSSVSVTGPVDLSGIKGSSLRTTGADTEISVGGGTITAAKDEDKSHNYYAARVDKGTININMKDGKAGTNTTKITGDMYVTDQYGKKVVEYTGGALVDCKDAGKLNVALTDKDSFWTGVAAYDQYNDSYGPGGNTMHDIGEFNLYLANGASWTNEQQAHVTTGTLDEDKQVWKGSQLASLHGGSDEAHAGIIYQKHEDPIFIENYSGHERVFYEHKKDDPASIKGGAFKIANAEEGSAITLITDSTGLSSRWKETDDAVSRKQVSDVLNQLAGKLYYGNYKDGHLKGTVEIADGLTVSSKVLKTDDILFYTDSDVTSGAAKEAGWGHVQDKAVPDSSTYKNVPITGNLDADAVPSQKPYVDAGIVRKDGTYKFTSDTVLETTKDYSTMIDAREDVVIDAAGKTLTLRGTIDTPSISTDEHERLALIQSGQGKNLTINAGRLVLDAEQSASGGNTYGMAIDGSVNPTHVTVNGNVDVTSTSKVKSNMGGAYGIWARGRAVIDIHGTVTMKKENGWAVDSDQNGFSFYGSGGILSTSVWGADLNQGATINVDNVDLKVNGNGLWTNIGGGIINVNGGSVEVNPNNGVGYSALLAECGTINMNVLKDADGNVTGAGNNDVTIKGNVFAATGAINDVDKGTYTSINLGLTNERSSLTGVIWNGFRDEGNKNTTKLFYGRTNLWLSDGAQWHHEPYGSVEVKDMNYYGDKFKGSVVSNFHGGSSEAHSGYIFQGTPSKKARKLGITFKNYNGYTIVFYNHDETDPTQMIGGDITIEKAAEGSGITLVTDSKGLTAGFSTSDKAADQNKVSEVLNKLAQKLFYTANDGHLAGTVKIADGLTASSKSLKSGAISFSSDSTGTKVKGQGFYEYEPASDDVLTDPITGGMDKKYVNIGVEKTQGHYDFAKDSTITVTAGQHASLIGTVDAVNGPVTINGKGTTLSLINDQKGSNVARAVSTGLSKGNDVSITADRLNLDARTSGFRAQGIYADKGTVYVNADTHISTKASSDSHGIYAGGSSVIHMNGGLSNDVDTTAEFYSLYADGNGRITVNMKDGKASGGKVNLKGDIYTESITSEDDYYDESSENSTVDMALSGKESSWHGRSVYSTSTSDDDSSKGYGDFNLILDDGAVWTNEKVGSGMDAGSHVTKLTGGAEGKSGFILQNDKNPIAVDHYSGDITVIYRHEVTDDSRRENAELYGNKAVTVSGGKFHITKADPGSSITLATDASGLNIGSRVYTDKNLVNDALDKLANQLVYAGYEDKDLTGTVRIAEGLTSPSISKALVEGKISYYDGKVAGTEAGEGYYHYRVVNPDAQTVDAYSQAITGDSAVDKVYVRTGVLEEGTHDYTFTKPDTTITVEKTLIAGGPWIRKISAAVSGGDNHDAYLQMNGNNLTVNTTSDTHTTGITAIGKGVVDLEDAGKVSVSAESTGGGQTAAIFVNGGGTVKVHNGTGDLDSKVLTLRAKGKNMANVAVIKAMNGIADAQSSIAIDGLVDVLADGKNGSNEAVSIVASKADIGGGSIKAVNGAAYAIRAYGEFNSANRAVVNVNTVKNAEGRITGAGNHRTEVEGNISLGGGMDSGAKAEVNLGLNTKDSYFKGDVAYLNASPNGQVNLYMGNGASWTGNNLSGSSVNARITGGASWTGYSSGNNMHLSLQEGALWNNIGSSHISSLAGNQGLIDMSGDKAGTVEAGNYSGNTTVIYRHEIKDNEGRDHASLYGNKEASIMGGDFKITNAAENSTITLLTDNAGVNTASTDYRDQNLVYDLMDKLAGKLYYSGYADGHLKGIVKIAEGLTASSAMMKMGDISFYTDKDKGKTAGEGYYKYDLVYPSEQVVNPMDKVIDGSEDSRNNYRDAGVYHDETESYDFTYKPAEVTASDHDDGVVHAKDNDVKVTTKDWLHVTAKDGGVGMASENRKTVSTEGNTQITAKDGIGVKADKGTVSLKGHTIISAGTGMEAVNGGTIFADGTTDMTAGEGKNALHADGDGSTISLKDGTISGAVLAENKGSISTAGAVLKGAATASKEGIIHLDGGSTSEGITADGGTIYTAGTDVKGEALTKAKGTLSMTGGNAGAVTADGGSASTDGTAVKGLLSAKNGGSITMTNGSAKGLSIDKDSAITAKLDKKDASIQGDIANKGTASLTLGGGASWIGDSTGSGKTNASIGEGSIWTGRSTNGNTTVELAGTWKQTGDSTIASLTGRNGTLDKTSETSGDTTIDHAAGTLNLLYSHSAEDPTTFYGGDTTIRTADSGTTVNMVTDSRGLTVSGNRARWANYRNQASETLNRMAHKLHYTANDGNIKGTLKIAEGLTSSSASLRAENLTFDETGTGSYVYDPVKDDLTIEYGSEETQMMKGTKSALLGVSMMWRSNNNDLQRRLGDLRLGQAESGVWARYVGGKNKFDEQNTYMSQTYDIGQVGYDRKAGSWLVGAALDYGKGDVNYTGGKGKEHMATLALYGTRVSDDGKYFDIIFKTGRLKNEFHVSNEIGNRLNADYHTWGNSISAEYGKRFVRDDGFYLDPSVELTMGRLNSKNFSGHSDLGELNVKQHDFDSAIGRIGLGIGRQTERSNAFLKLALAHEFGGSFKTDFYADDGGLKSTRIDLQDTWLDMEIGGSLSIGRNTYLYGTYTHNFGADMETKWRADVGVRYTF